MDDVQPRQISEAPQPRHVETAQDDAPDARHPEAATAPRHAPAHAAPEPAPQDPPSDPVAPAHASPEPAPQDAPSDRETPGHATAEPDRGPTPLLLEARGLEMAGRSSMVFGPLDLDLRTDQVAVVTGQQGSGRSALLLALAGRLKGVQGSLQVGAVDGIAHPRALRQQVSIARISGLADLEPQLTVGESRDERAISEGIGTRRGREQFSRLEDLLDHRYQTDDLVDHLPAVEKTLLTLMLGCLRPAAYVVCDDVDDRLTDAQLGWMHDGIAVLREDGHHFVLSSLDQSPLPEASRVIHLQPPPSRDADFVPTHSLRRRLASLREDA